MSYSTQNKEEITFNQKEHQQPQVGTDQRQIAPCLIWKKKNQGSLASSQSLILLRKSSWGNPKEITSLSFLGLTFNLFKNRVIPFTSSVWCTEWKEKDGWSNNAWTPIKWSYSYYICEDWNLRGKVIFENKMHANCLSNFAAFAKPTTYQGLKIHQRQSVKW